MRTLNISGFYWGGGGGGGEGGLKKLMKTGMIEKIAAKKERSKFE